MVVTLRVGHCAGAGGGGEEGGRRRVVWAGLGFPRVVLLKLVSKDLVEGGWCVTVWGAEPVFWGSVCKSAFFSCVFSFRW